MRKAVFIVLIVLGVALAALPVIATFVAFISILTSEGVTVWLTLGCLCAALLLSIPGVLLVRASRRALSNDHAQHWDLHFFMRLFWRHLPLIVCAVLFTLATANDQVSAAVFPNSHNILTRLLSAIFLGAIAPLTLIVHFIGTLCGHPLTVMHRPAAVLGAMFYGAILYYAWYHARRCPSCSSLRRRYVGVAEETRSHTSPDTVVTKRYNADGDYVGYAETEVGESTAHWTVQVSRYRCRACGHEWSLG